MNWIDVISKSINYIENHLLEDIKIVDVAKEVYMSPLYLQKGFSIMCNYTISEYIRNRRLSLAGKDLMNTDEKIIDIAQKYCYDSPDSFNKAFNRFHSSTPNSVRKNGATIKEFAPLRINIDLKGGYTMEYKIEDKDAFKVIGLSNKFKYDNAYEDVPKMWHSFKETETNKISTKYGVNMDIEMSGNEFIYMICDDYKEGMEVPKGYEIREIPKYTWAVFSCYGSAYESMPKLNEKIFKEWLPNSGEYEIAAGYNIEMYSNPSTYKNGIMDFKYYSEVWIPVKKIIK